MNKKLSPACVSVAHFYLVQVAFSRSLARQHFSLSRFSLDSLVRLFFSRCAPRVLLGKFIFLQLLQTYYVWARNLHSAEHMETNNNEKMFNCVDEGRWMARKVSMRRNSGLRFSCRSALVRMRANVLCIIMYSKHWDSQAPQHKAGLFRLEKGVFSI